jgi:hypothetical protein
VYPKLLPDPVDVDINGRILRIPRDKIASAFAGAVAARELMLKEMSGFSDTFTSTFKEEYQEAMPACITAANQVGLSATSETLDYWNPAVPLGRFVREKLEHKDNPFYPFLEED